MGVVRGVGAPLLASSPSENRRISFAKGIKLFDAKSYSEVKNPELNRSLAQSIAETLLPKLNVIFNKNLEKVEVKVPEPTYPYFTDVMKLAYPYKKPERIMDESDTTAGLTNSETGTIYINKELILKNNPLQPGVQKAFFTLTLIHELLHLYGDFQPFVLEGQKGQTESFNTEFLHEGMPELFARTLLQAVYPKEYLECRKAERLGTNERTYSYYLDIAENLEFLLDSTILISSFSKMDAENIYRILSKIDESAALELFRAASLLSDELTSSERELDAKKMGHLNDRVHAALARLKKKMLDSERQIDKATEKTIIGGLRSQGFLSQEYFDTTKVKTIDGLNKYVLGLFPSSSDYDRYVLGQSAADIAGIEGKSVQITIGTIGATIHKYLRSFEELHGVSPIEIERFIEFMVDKKLSEYTGSLMPELNPYRKKAEQLLGETSSWRYTESDLVWLGKALGFPDAQKNPEAMAYLFDLVMERLHGNNIFNPSRKEIAAFVLYFLDSQSLSAPYALENTVEALESNVRQLKSERRIMGHKSTDELFQATAYYLRLKKGVASEPEVAHLCSLLGMCNSFVHPDRMITIDKEIGVIRVDREGFLANPFEFQLVNLPHEFPYIATEKVK